MRRAKFTNDDGENLLGCRKTGFVEINAQFFHSLDGSIDSVKEEDLGSIRKGVFNKNNQVSIPHLAVGKYPVTRELYKTVAALSKKKYDMSLDAEPSTWKEFLPQKGETRNLIACDNLNWFDCVFFCNTLSDQCIGAGHQHYKIRNIEVQDGHIYNAEVEETDSDGFRLLTEAEWEFCARGGNPGTDEWRYPFSGCMPDGFITKETGYDSCVSKFAWFGNDSLNLYRIDGRLINISRRVRKKFRNLVLNKYDFLGVYGPHEVGMKKPNALGLYDMSGNVHEWVWDEWDGENKNPQGSISEPFVKKSRCMRGGGWPNQPIDIIVTSRWALHPAFYASMLKNEAYKSPNGTSDVGFRICRTLK